MLHLDCELKTFSTIDHSSIESTVYIAGRYLHNAHFWFPYQKRNRRCASAIKGLHRLWYRRRCSSSLLHVICTKRRTKWQSQHEVRLRSVFSSSAFFSVVSFHPLYSKSFDFSPVDWTNYIHRSTTPHLKHSNVLSHFIRSLRGFEPNCSLYQLLP